MEIDEPEILDLKSLMSGECEAPTELTPERWFWWHFWALWLHDALYNRWGMISPSQVRDLEDRENYYNSLFGKKNRENVLEMLDLLVEDSAGTLKKFKRYVDTRPKPKKIRKFNTDGQVFTGQPACTQEYSVAGEFNSEIPERHLELYPRLGRNYRR